MATGDTFTILMDIILQHFQQGMVPAYNIGRKFLTIIELRNETLVASDTAIHLDYGM